jgi:hypothetical protein
MNELAQQIIVGAIVLLAVIYLITRSRKKACGTGGCGCSGKKGALAKEDESPK